MKINNCVWVRAPPKNTSQHRLAVDWLRQSPQDRMSLLKRFQNCVVAGTEPHPIGVGLNINPATDVRGYSHREAGTSPHLLEFFTTSLIPLGTDRRTPWTPRKHSYLFPSASLRRLLQRILHVSHLSVVVYHRPLHRPFVIRTVSRPPCL